jgi:ribosomal-protein-alanine N-acetyltransferase
MLRPYAREDIDALHDLWITPSVRRYLWDDIVIPRETAEQVVESHFATSEQHGIGYWAIHIPFVEGNAGASLSGFCGFRFIDQSPDIELMYGLRTAHWGNGLATEACLEILNYLWRSTSFEKVYGRTDPPNERSAAVLRRLGMTHVSTTPSMITYVLFRPA